QKIKAARIRDLIRFIFWLRFADRGVGERHLGASQIRAFGKAPGYAPESFSYTRSWAITESQ
ncbi:MAG: hypothetical protein J0H81_10625, partial [Sphingopyxis terrae]|nr:hypothetical protein [Sphingopyxis terrae]